MEYQEFYNLLFTNKIISQLWIYICNMIYKELENNDKKQDIVKLLIIYFSLVDDGNTCMSLNKDVLLEKWTNKMITTKALLEDRDDFNQEKYDLMKDESLACIANNLELINEKSIPEIIGNDKLFIIDNGWLYFRKYYTAKETIAESVHRLFNISFNKELNFDYKACVNEEFQLSKGQEEVVTNGIKKNMIITGGPGTGKTTTILFLLFALLSDDKSYNIHLVAPSGKASSRMKESIINSLKVVKESYKESHSDIVSIIENLEESTIHRLLSIDAKTNTFKYNKNYQFKKDSIFIVDEASMIDICLFNNLLQAIPTGSRLFIMGDKNQLPSVESGAVFAELLKNQNLNDNGNIVELIKSNRFSEDTKIYKLAKEINEGAQLSIDNEQWLYYEEFNIKGKDDSKPIYFYYLDENNKKEIVQSVVKKWASHYYMQLQQEATDLDINDSESLNNLLKISETAKILCCENEGIIGVKNINDYIKKICIDKTLRTSIDNAYAGQLMMINKNNKILDLYNGDSGILVTLKFDDSVYFMIKKKIDTLKNDGYRKDEIFKIGDLVFYPLRLISNSDISLSYAITVHKSQGSDYENILIILPTKKGNPLLNRQIIYTAITRTKGNTYILSSQQRLEEAKNNVLVRDTNIF